MIRRHSLVWLKSPPLALESLSLTEAWFEAGNPFIVCRTRSREELSLGFCLPRSPGVTGSPDRYAAHGKLADITIISRPPSVSEALRLSASGTTGSQCEIPWAGWPQAPEGCALRIIGSSMWELLTGVKYRTETSDIDLVLDVADAGGIDKGAAYLEQLFAQSPGKLDAEISIPNRGEVHAKEWLSLADPVLVKSLASVQLQPREWVRQTLCL